MTWFDLEDTDLLCEFLSGDAHCKLVVIIWCHHWYLGQFIPSEYTLSSYLDAFIAQRYGANFTPICAQCSQMGTSFFWYLPIFYRKTDTRSALTVSNNHRKHTWNLKYPCAYMLGHKWVNLSPRKPGEEGHSPTPVTCYAPGRQDAGPIS